MNLIKRHRPPEDSEALGNRALDALERENYSVWPSRRKAAIIEQAEWAGELREDDTGAMRNPMPIEVYLETTSGQQVAWEGSLEP